ncbi:MAG: hypothetical protein RIT14_1067 [Pseudomonadota bacterium]|jgi:NADPH2:quinone reductase
MIRAWQIDSLTAPATLRQIPTPVPGPGQARIRIAACGLNFADLLMAEGRYQQRPALPFIPGMECAGVIEALGPATPDADPPPGPPLTPGSRVALCPGHGGLAEAGVFDIASLLPLPDTMDDITAAGFQIAYGTSHLALTHKARLQPGETLLVLGAAGGVGLTAVEVGKALGARVIACARGADRLAIARAAGADAVIDSDTPDLKAALKDMGGVDVVYDPVGGAAFDAALRAMRPDGRLLAIGFASGQVPQVPANLLLVKNIAVLGFWWGGYAGHPVARQSLATLIDWHAQGRLRPHVSHVLPMEDLHRGLDLLRNRAATGKVIVKTTADPA